MKILTLLMNNIGNYIDLGSFIIDSWTINLIIASQFTVLGLIFHWPRKGTEWDNGKDFF